MRTPHIQSLLALTVLLSAGGSLSQAEVLGFYREVANNAAKHVLGIDSATGNLTELETIDYVAGNANNVNFSAADNSVYGLVSDNGSKMLRYDVATQTGGISPVLTGPADIIGYNFSNVDRDTGINYLITRLNTGEEALATVDPVTGVVTKVHGTNTWNNGGSTFPSSQTFDSDSNRFIFIAQDPANGNAQSYFSIDASNSPALIAAVVGTIPSAIGFDTVNNTLYGVIASGGTGQLISINPGTGASANIGSTFALGSWDQTFTIDPINGLALLTGTSGGGKGLFSIDLATGNATVSPNMDFATPGLRDSPNGLVAVTTEAAAPPRITRIVVHPTEIEIRWTSKAGSTYRIETSVNLQPPWNFAAFGIPGAAGETTATSPRNLGETARYFRVVEE